MELIVFPEAEERIEEILSYLLSKFGYKVKEDFKNLLNEKVQILKSFPSVAPTFNSNQSIRKYVITQHNTLYYRYREEKEIIEILTVFDTRQHPEKLNKNIK